MKAKSLFVSMAAAAGCVLSASALAHTRLESSMPQANAVVAPAPTQLRLQFSDPLELPFSKVKLVDEKGTVLEPTKIAVDGANPKALVATIPVLRPGAYRVQWSTVTRDGHKVKGEFGFRVK
jgi:methionine-rich copper-binding protein CopC